MMYLGVIQLILIGVHMASLICMLLSFTDFGRLSDIILSMYFLFHILSPLEHLLHTLNIWIHPTHLFCVFSSYFSLKFSSHFFLFNLSSNFLIFSYFACKMMSSNRLFQLLYFLSLKLLHNIFQIPIFWWNYPSCHLFSMFSLFLEYIYQIYFKVFFCSFLYLVHL